MAVEVRILSGNDSLERHQDAIRKAESRGFRLLSIACGVSSSFRANLITFVPDVVTPPKPITLENLAGALTGQQQQDRLNTDARELVCYGSLYVSGVIMNVVALR